MKTKLIIPLAMLVFVSPVFATTARSLSIQDLVNRADLIVRGRIVASNTFYVRKYGMNYTRLTILVKKTYMGKQTSKTVVVTLPGGTVNGRVQVVFGVPVLKTGESAILFLRQVGSRTGIVGLGQGTFIINPALGRVSRRLNRVRLVGEDFRFPTDLTDFERLLKSSIQKRTPVKK